MESTSIYWIPVWRILEAYFPLKLVNPYFIKQLPGKKSDVKDAEWIATCLLKELIRGSYVPEERIQQLRQYDRRIFDLNKEIVYKLTKLDAALQRCNIRIINRVGKETIIASLTGIITQVDIDVIHQMLEEIKLAQLHRDDCLAKMEEMVSTRDGESADSPRY